MGPQRVRRKYLGWAERRAISMIGCDRRICCTQQGEGRQRAARQEGDINLTKLWSNSTWGAGTYGVSEVSYGLVRTGRVS